jgi:chloramphenicol O-acetyltransferase type A
MRQIHIETWGRKEHFNLYKGFTNPHLNLTANIDLTAYFPFVKQMNLTINIALIYVLSRTANEIPEFRQRIRDDIVIEHGTVHPSTTIMTSNNLFSFCTFDYDSDFKVFSKSAAEMIAFVKKNRTLEDEPGRDDMLFMTAIPWVSFTNILHPVNLDPPDSFPRIAWGKITEKGERLVMPLSLQAHHGLVDGVHMGRYYEMVQDYLDHPEFVLKE